MMRQNCCWMSLTTTRYWKCGLGLGKLKAIKGKFREAVDSAEVGMDTQFYIVLWAVWEDMGWIACHSPVRNWNRTFRHFKHTREGLIGEIKWADFIILVIVPKSGGKVLSHAGMLHIHTWQSCLAPGVCTPWQKETKKLSIVQNWPCRNAYWNI